MRTVAKARRWTLSQTRAHVDALRAELLKEKGGYMAVTEATPSPKVERPKKP